MQAILYHQFRSPVELADVPDPAPSADGAVIAVRATGICRSDWHGWQGHDADIRELPHVPGHEFAGEVVAVGRDVLHWSAGDRVTMPFVAGCGACPECASGNQQVCDRQYQPGFTGWGSFAEYVAVRYADENLVRLPDPMDFATAASLGCRFSTAYRAVALQGRVQAGDWVAVHGCGGVGLSAVMIATALGAKPIAIDIRPESLQLAYEFGAVAAVLAADDVDVSAELHRRTGRGADLSLDCLGSRVTCANSILSLRKRGRHVQVGLLAGRDESPPLPMGRVIAWELEICGSHGLQAQYYPALLQLIQEKQLPVARLIHNSISLAEAGDVLMGMERFNQLGITVVDRFNT